MSYKLAFLRKTLIYFFFIFSAFFVSCSSDGDNSIDISASIVGTWTAIDVEFEGTAVATAQGQHILLSYTGEPKNLNHTLTFEESPNAVISKGGFDLEITYNFNEQIETNLAEATSLVEDGTWEQNSSELTITDFEGDGGVIEIFELKVKKW